LAYIGYVKQIGVEIVSIKPEVMGYLIAIFSIFNGIGRVVYGKLIDMKGFLFSAILNYLLTVFTSVTLWLYPSYTMFILTSIIIYLTLGGWMVIAPTEIRTVISSNKYSLTWPLLMTGYSTAVLVGTVIAGLIRDVTGSFKLLFIVSLFITLVLGLIPIYMFYRKMCKH
jgi:MFS family permease